MTENFSQPMKEIYRFKKPSNSDYKHLFSLGNLGVAQVEIKKKPKSRCIIVKLQKNKDKKKILKE